MLEADDVFFLGVLVGGVFEGIVVEDIAVLIDLDEGRPAGGCGAVDGGGDDERVVEAECCGAEKAG